MKKRRKRRQARWQSIAEAAAKQSKRRIVPEVGAVCTLKEALEQTKEMDLKLIPYELSEGMMRTKKLIESAAAPVRKSACLSVRRAALKRQR